MHERLDVEGLVVPEGDSEIQRAREERWDPEKRRLVITMTETLRPEIRRSLVDMPGGRFLVRESGTGQAKLSTRVYVLADTEAAARGFAAQNAQDIFTTAQSGGEVVVRAKDIKPSGTGKLRGWRLAKNSKADMLGEGQPKIRAEVVLDVPRGARMDYIVQTSTGDLKIKRGKGSCVFRGASGDVDFGRFDGAVNVETQSGDVRGKELSGDVRVRTVSGGVSLAGLDGSAHIHTATGDIRCDSGTFHGESLLETQGGAVKVGVANRSLRIEAQTENGTMMLQPGALGTVDRSDSGLFMGMLGNGENRGDRLRISSRDGNISIERSKSSWLDSGFLDD